MSTRVLRALLLAAVLLALLGGALPSGAAALASPEPPCEILPGSSSPTSEEICAEEIAEWHEEQEEDRRREEKEEREIRAEERVEEKEAREWAHKPTVTLHLARLLTVRTMRNSGLENWWIDCRGGRIDRTHWSCKVSLFYHCLRGRMRIWGAGYRNGRRWYGSQAGKFHPCRI
jgi:hypothetical protein